MIHVGAPFSGRALEVLRAGLGARAVSWGGAGPGGRAANLGVEGGLAPAGTEIWFGQPPVEALERSDLRWIHLTSAGWTRFDTEPVRQRLRARGLALTTSSTVYAEPCAEHALALTLALLRRLPEAAADQHGPRSWPAARLRASSRGLRGARVLVLGYGAIARRLLELLAPFGAEVLVVRRERTGRETHPVVSREEAFELLPSVDVVIDTLPEAPGTRGFVDAAWICALSPRALVVNVGRGTTIDQAALVDALRTGRLGGAGLDVTDPEPLPPDHPLWSLANVLITPHSAGGREDEFVRIVEHFLANLARWDAGLPLLDRVG